MVESEDYALWIGCEGLRQIWPGLPTDAQLRAQGTGPMLWVQDTRRLYLSTPAMRLCLFRARGGGDSAQVMHFLDWFDRHVAQAARRRRDLAGLEGNPQRPGESDDRAWQQDVPIDMPLPKRVAAIATKAMAGIGSVWFAPTWRGERGPVKTLAVLIATVILFDALLGRLVGVDLDPTRSFGIMLWAFMLVITAAAGLSIWMIVGMTRSTWRAFSRPAGILWATPLWIIGLSMAPLLSVGEFEQDLVLEWWDSVTGRYRPASVDADPYLGRIVVSGEFKFGSAQQLESVLRSNPSFTLVEFRSPGGYVLEGMRMAKIVMARGVDTAALERCASACTLVLAGGQERYIGPNAQVGFHRSGSRYAPISLGWSRTDHQIADFYASRGASQAFIEKALTPPISDIWWAPHEALLSSGFATHLWSERRPGY